MKTNQLLMLMEYGGQKNLWAREYDGIHRTTFIIDENG
jgi:peroxiredoxin